MSDVAIKVEGLGKQYRLGEIGTGTISHDLNRWWARMRGKEDPFAKVGEANDRTAKGSSDYVWSLRDIDFEVKRGAGYHWSQWSRKIYFTQNSV
jgi:lipopolysaccharide transport system ATP-binding protein